MALDGFMLCRENKLWWTRGDLNPRPLQCQCSVHTKLDYLPIFFSSTPYYPLKVTNQKTKIRKIKNRFFSANYSLRLSVFGLEMLRTLYHLQIFIETASEYPYSSSIVLNGFII